MQARTKIFLLTRNLPPLRGGMERLNAKMAVELAEVYDVVVFAPKGTVLPRTSGIRLKSSPIGGTLGFLLWVSFAAAFAALLQRPARVLGGSGLLAPSVWAAARMARAHSAIYLHGLDIVVNHAGYRLIWLPFIRRAHLLFANSRNTARLAAEAGVEASRIVIVPPGAESPSAVQDVELVRFRHRHGLRDVPLLLSVGRLTERKGIAEFIEFVLPEIWIKEPLAVLVIIGDNAQDALAKGHQDQKERLDKLIDREGSNGRIRVLGPVDDVELAAAYETADLHVFPVRDVFGDVEGFGMVAIEAAAHGLPTVAFSAGGVPDAIADGVSGILVAAGDYQGFATAALHLLSEGRAKFSVGCRDFARSFSWSAFGVRMRKAIQMHGSEDRDES